MGGGFAGTRVGFTDIGGGFAGTLRALCAALELEWEPAMLQWEPGPRPEDGVWAPWWYAGDQSDEGRGYIPTGWTNPMRGEGIYLQGGPTR
eukprot:1940692-Pyramimonas_sp.AAC.1